MWPLNDVDGNTDAVVELRKDVSPEKTLRREAARRHHHLDALTRISCAVSGLADLDNILHVALDTVLQIFGESIGGVLLFDEELQKLCYKVHRGLSAKFAGEMCLLPGEGVAGKVAITGEPVLLEDISQDTSAARPDLIRAEGLRGFVSVPLKAKDKVVGVMNLASYLAGQFSTDDMYLLDSIGYLLGTAVEQARLYEGLDDARERYQRLLREVLTVQEQERKRIARDLHDETSQELTAVTFNLQAINDMMGMGGVVNPQIESMLKKTLALASHASSELTKLIRELRPTLLDTLGLPAAIRRLAEAKLGAQGIEVATEFEGMDRRLPAEMELVLFRITQEAISNIVKHAGAKNARIGLQCTADRCVLRVEDDGEGFDVHKLSRIDSYGRGAGLFSMKERVAMAGGECAIDSAPGHGTTVVAQVPVIGNSPDKEG
jgi:signal transduction histidine kinase